VRQGVGVGVWWFLVADGYEVMEELLGIGWDETRRRVRKYDYDPANAAVEFSIGCESETSRRHLLVSHRVNIDRIHHGAATMAVHCLPLNAASGGGSKGQKGVSVWAVMLRCPFLSGARHDEAC
jgi:hypothetical protein